MTLKKKISPPLEKQMSRPGLYIDEFVKKIIVKKSGRHVLSKCHIERQSPPLRIKANVDAVLGGGGV